MKYKIGQKLICIKTKIGYCWEIGEVIKLVDQDRETFLPHKPFECWSYLSQKYHIVLSSTLDEIFVPATKLEILLWM